MTTTKTAARLAVDIGGTFTDIVLDANGRRWTGKVLTTPRAPEEAVIAAVHEILGEAGLEADALGLFILGTTLATNALIERKGAKTALLTTAGFRDLVEIGWEHRFAQYYIFLDKPEPLVPRYLRLPVPERIDAKGRVLLPLDDPVTASVVPDVVGALVPSLAESVIPPLVDPDPPVGGSPVDGPPVDEVVAVVVRPALSVRPSSPQLTRAPHSAAPHPQALASFAMAARVQ